MKSDHVITKFSHFSSNESIPSPNENLSVELKVGTVAKPGRSKAL